MSTISSLTSSIQTQRADPRDQMDKTIAAAVKAGVLSQTDATAIESALDKIDKSLSTSSASQSSTSLDPSQMKNRIDGLINQQVSDGTLTKDQADELKAFFQAGPGGGQDGASGSGTQTSSTGSAAATTAGGAPPPGGAGGAGGESQSTDTTTDTDGDGIPDYLDSQPTVYNAPSTTSTSSTSTSSTESDGDSDGDTGSNADSASDVSGSSSKLDALKQFLANLRDSQNQGQDTYAVGKPGQNGQNGLIVNQFA